MPEIKNIYKFIETKNLFEKLTTKPITINMNNETNPIKPLLTTDEVAAILKMSTTEIRRKCRENKLKYLRDGRKYLFEQDSIIEHIERMKKTS